MAAAAPAAAPTPAPAAPTPAATPAAAVSASLYVGDLERDVTEAQLYELFAQVSAQNALPRSPQAARHPGHFRRDGGDAGYSGVRWMCGWHRTPKTWICAGGCTSEWRGAWRFGRRNYMAGRSWARAVWGGLRGSLQAVFDSLYDTCRTVTERWRG